MMKHHIVCLDFDGVINRYPGWENEGFVTITGEPFPEAAEQIQQLRDAGVMILVHSTRCGYRNGTGAIANYLEFHNIPVDGVCFNKPPADLYIDDKACLHTKWEGMAAKVLALVRPKPK